MKTREERMYEHLYSNEGRVEQCERICKLEEYVQEMTRYIERLNPAFIGPSMLKDLRSLGIEVES